MIKVQTLLLASLSNIVIIVALTLFFNILKIPTLIPCTYPPSQSLALALCATLVIQFSIISRFWLIRSKPIISIYLLFLLLTFWMGSYSFSPLGFSTGRIPVIRGFMITRFSRPPIPIASGGLVNIAGDSISEIKPITQPVDLTCTWASTNGGSFDDPGSCDTVYLSPVGTYYDTLKLLIRPACHLPNTVGEIKVSILP